MLSYYNTLFKCLAIARKMRDDPPHASSILIAYEDFKCAIFCPVDEQSWQPASNSVDDAHSASSICVRIRATNHSAA